MQCRQGQCSPLLQQCSCRPLLSAALAAALALAGVEGKPLSRVATTANGDSLSDLMAWVAIYVLSPLSLLSVIVIILGFLEAHGSLSSPRCCCSSYHGPNLLLLLAWPFLVALPLYLVIADQIWVMLVFVIGGAVWFMLHASVLFAFWLRSSRSAKAADHPRQQLLTDKPSDKARGRPGTGKSLDVDVEAPTDDVNPFRQAYGILPGTSQMAYQIFLPTDIDFTESEQPDQRQQRERDSGRDRKHRHSSLPSEHPTSHRGSQSQQLVSPTATSSSAVIMQLPAPSRMLGPGSRPRP